MRGRNHPVIRALQSEVRAASSPVEEARGALAPDPCRSNLSATETFEDPIPSREGRGGSLSLTLSQPIYRGGQLGSLERQALAQAAATARPI